MQEVAKNPSQSGHRVHPRGRSDVGRDVVPSPYSKWLSDALERIHSPSSFHHNNSDSAALRTYVGSASENSSIQAARLSCVPTLTVQTRNCLPHISAYAAYRSLGHSQNQSYSALEISLKHGYVPLMSAARRNR